MLGHFLPGMFLALWSVGASSKENVPPLELTLDKNKVDLEGGQLEIRLSRAASKVTVKVIDPSGSVLAKVEKAFEGAAAGTPLVVHWQVKPGATVARIEVFGYDTRGYYKGVAVTPWSFNVPHQEVVFESGSALIRSSEETKLDKSFRVISKSLNKHRSLGSITLYVAAHTDTVGTITANEKLSMRRARAIARWFRKRGLKLPIAYAGLGESTPKVPTADGIPEARNRRVDYSLALEPPRFKQSRQTPPWRTLGT